VKHSGDKHVEHLVIEQDRTIQGSVEAGATVRDGATLVVQGVVSGNLLLEGPEAVITVQGVLNVDPGSVRNSGTILAAGLVAGNPGDAVTPDGRFAVALGTAIAGSGEPYQVMADGSTRLLPPDDAGNVTVKAGDIQVDASRYAGYRASDNTWVVLD
jgi:hypothetical protein